MKEPALTRIEKLGRAVSGMTVRELARAVGITYGYIWTLLPRLKVKPRKRGRWPCLVSTDECEAMAKLHDQGITIEAIAVRYGVNPKYIGQAIRRVRRDIVSTGAIQRRARDEKIRQLLARGMTPDQAWEKLSLKKTPTMLKIESLGDAVSGMYQAELARAIGVTRERIRQLVPLMKVKPRNQREEKRATALSIKECEAIARLHDYGVPYWELAHRHGLSRYQIQKVIERVRKDEH